MVFYRKSQVSIEYIFLIGFLLILLVPVFYYAIDKTRSTIDINQADDAVNTIANAADRVYSLGPGSRDHVWITFPYTLVSTTVASNEVMVVINLKGKNSEIHTSTIAELTGSLPSTPGTHKIAIEMLDNGVVQIGTNATPTCSNQGFVCCDTCVPGTEQTIYDSTCSGKACCSQCYTATCSDGVKNQDESDIDCGGVCGKTCIDGKLCNSDADCVNQCNLTSHLCYSQGVADYYYYVDSAADEIIFLGESSSGTWQSTNARDLVYRVINEQSVATASTIFSDGFEDQVVGDVWTVYQGDGSIKTGSYEHSGSYAVEADDFDNCFSPGYMEKSFDLSDAANASLVYWYFPGDIEPSEWMKVEVNDGSGYVTHTTHWGTDNGDTTPNPGDYTQYTIGLGSYDLVANFKIRFSFCGDSSNDNHWLDDISMTKTIPAYRLNMTYIIDDIPAHTSYLLNISGKSVPGENFNIYAGTSLLGSLTTADSYITANVSSYISNGYLNISIIDATSSSDAVKDSLYVDFIAVKAS